MADRPYGNPSSTRSVSHSGNGMVATSQPLATLAGIQILQSGGNAFDAAVATAAVLTVVEPMQTGLGGDMFALLYSQKNKKVEGLNGSGRAPSKATYEYYREKGYEKMPLIGSLSITTPGTVDGWSEILEKHGTMTFEEVLQPAIYYAEHGFPVSEIIAAQWKRAEGLLRKDVYASKQYLIDNRAPKEGELFKNPALAKTLKAVAKFGKKAFYEGDIAQEMVRALDELDGLLTLDDLKNHTSEWVVPIKTSYKGYEMYQIPPNGQGLTTIKMLNILENFDFSEVEHNSFEYIHLLTEAKKIAYSYRDKYIADPSKGNVDIEKMLSKELAKQNAEEIKPNELITTYNPSLEIKGDTVYLTVVDKDRNVISFINSLYTPFGSGVVGGETGVFLQNRANGFSLEENHLNVLEPNKRPFHTIIPALVLKEEKPFMSYGVMGGDMQPQGQVQVLLNILEYNMNIQEAGEAPRFRHFPHGLALESEIDAKTTLQLLDVGHRVISALDDFGGFQGIMIDPETNLLKGGSDPRKDGMALGY